MNGIDAKGAVRAGANVRDFAWRHRDLVQLVLLTALIFALMSALNPSKFLRPYNFESIAFVAPELGLLALAVMLSMLTRGLDLSIIGIANLSGILAGMFFHAVAGGTPVAELGLGTTLVGVAIAVATGLVAGLFNAFLIARLKVTPILATIGSGQLFAGLGLVLTGGPAIVGYPATWGLIGNGHVAGIAVPLTIFVAVAVVIGVFLTRTPLGIGICLYGASPTAAVFAALRTRLILITCYAMTGTLASLAGILLSARTNAARSDYGTSYLLQAVLIAVLGGTNPAGGRGSVLGISVALVALMLLSNGLQLMRFSNFLVDFVWGAFLLLVIAINAVRRGRR